LLAQPAFKVARFSGLEFDCGSDNSIFNGSLMKTDGVDGAADKVKKHSPGAVERRSF
jgi:hypothetical protein